jgi:hypothetical protein
MTQQNQEPVVVLDDKEMKVSDLTPQQQYFHRQILDLNNKKQQTEFQLDQINASLSVFNDAFIKSTKEQADEVLNDDTPEEEN